ncbi:LytTR family DNA-binding domain-containing protein [Arthrobacter sp. SDTb3-6]|uniref:LytTR family DNA-binding domain-containing protein n=1 Tax=Arthrobacter sp. SDTb3-6 TaxID=2713571 RepID=UPI0035240262
MEMSPGLASGNQSKPAPGIMALSLPETTGENAISRMAEASYLVRVSLSDLEQRWQGAGFLRIHRSYLVCMPCATALRLGSAKPTVSVGNAELPVSRRHLPAVREHLQATRPLPRRHLQPPAGCASRPRAARTASSSAAPPSRRRSPSSRRWARSWCGPSSGPSCGWPWW